MMDQKEDAMEILPDALVEHFEGIELFFKMVPEYREDDDIKAMIKYFEGEI